MNDKEFETLKFLLELHHNAMTERRNKIHSITERTVALFVIIAGWLLSSGNSLSFQVRSVVIIGVVIIMVVSCITVKSNDRVAKENVEVVKKISTLLGVHERGKFIDGDTLYPQRWQLEKAEKYYKGYLHHWITIAVTGILCISAAML